MACSACTCILPCVDVLENVKFKSGPVRKTLNIMDANLSGFTVCGTAQNMYFLQLVDISTTDAISTAYSLKV